MARQPIQGGAEETRSHPSQRSGTCSRNLRSVKNRKRVMRSDITHTNGNERRKHDEDRNKNIDEREAPYQITNDKPDHLRRLCNITRITLLHTSGRIGKMDIDRRKVEKTPDYIRTPWYTDDGKSFNFNFNLFFKKMP
jgi:hypothetical protein